MFPGMCYAELQKEQPAIVTECGQPGPRRRYNLRVAPAPHLAMRRTRDRSCDFARNSRRFSWISLGECQEAGRDWSLWKGAARRPPEAPSRTDGAPADPLIVPEADGERGRVSQEQFTSRSRFLSGSAMASHGNLGAVSSPMVILAPKTKTKKKHFVQQKVKVLRASSDPVLGVFMWGVNHSVRGETSPERPQGPFTSVSSKSHAVLLLE